MPAWDEFSVPELQVLSACKDLKVPELKSECSELVEFEDINRNAISAVLVILAAILNRTGIRIKYRGLERVRGRRLVFVSNHQGGNLDAIMIALLLFAKRGRVVFIAASERVLKDNILKQISSYLKYVGLFFIRSKFEGDDEYITAVSSFMNTILDKKESILFFIEGSASRSGKPGPPRRGLVKSLISKPVTFCPVSITYESCVSDTLINNEDALPTNILDIALRRNIGTVYINFGHCLDASPEDDHREVTNVLAQRIYTRIPVLSVDLVALLLNHGYVKISDIAPLLRKLELFVRSRNIIVIRSDINTALNAIKHIVDVSGDKVKVLDKGTLTFYANRATASFVDLTPIPKALSYEFCVNLEPVECKDEVILGIAKRIITPYIEVYQRLFSHLRSGMSKYELKPLTTPLNPKTTITNYLHFLTDNKLIQIVNDRIIVVSA